MILKDKVVLVTGAGSGIGKEIVLALLAKGAKVAAVDMKEKALKELVSTAKANIGCLSTYVANISDKKAVATLPKTVMGDLGQIDCIMNVAGIIQPFIRINDLEYESIERVMNVNFYGTLYMVKSFLPELLKRPEAYIVNVSSMGGFLPVPGQSVYGASKAAVKLMTEGLYAELAETNVHVSVVFPGATATNIAENSGMKIPNTPKTGEKTKEFPMLPADECARLILRGMEKNKLQIFTGKDSNFMNKLYRLNPVFATNFITKQMKSLLPK